MQGCATSPADSSAVQILTFQSPEKLQKAASFIRMSVPPQRQHILPRDLAPAAANIYKGRRKKNNNKKTEAKLCSRGGIKIFLWWQRVTGRNPERHRKYNAPRLARTARRSEGQPGGSAPGTGAAAVPGGRAGTPSPARGHKQDTPPLPDTDQLDEATEGRGRRPAAPRSPLK